MDVKKNPKANLENKRGLFFSIGLVIALISAYSALEYKSPTNEIRYQQASFIPDILEELIPITHPKELKKPKPLPLPANINVVDDLEEILEEANYLDNEFDEDEAIISFEIESEVEDVKPLKFYIVEDLPLFPGCEDIEGKDLQNESFRKEISKHVRKYFRYPEIAKEMGIQGKVYVQFVIEKDGSISNIIIARGVDKSLNNEALRIVNKLPKLTPAKQRGAPVSVSFVLPITFRLN